MGVLAIPEDAQTLVLSLWNEERDLIRKTLTDTEIKKAVGDPGFTRADALTYLEALGYSAADANVFLDS
jgi:hypothetical protein